MEAVNFSLDTGELASTYVVLRYRTLDIFTTYGGGNHGHDEIATT
jgi:hypothetical protein